MDQVIHARFSGMEYMSMELGTVSMLTDLVGSGGVTRVRTR